MSNNLEDKESEKNSEKLYSFNEGQKKPNNFESEAIRRSIGDIDVNINNSKKIEEIDMNVPRLVLILSFFSFWNYSSCIHAYIFFLLFLG